MWGKRCLLLFRNTWSHLIPKRSTLPKESYTSDYYAGPRLKGVPFDFQGGRGPGYCPQVQFYFSDEYHIIFPFLVEDAVLFFFHYLFAKIATRY